MDNKRTPQTIKRQYSQRQERTISILEIDGDNLSQSNNSKLDVVKQQSMGISSGMSNPMTLQINGLNDIENIDDNNSEM